MSNIVKHTLDLAECMSAYCMFLQSQADVVSQNHALGHPAHLLNEWKMLEHKMK